MSVLQLVKCACDNCKDEVIGYRINQEGIRFLVCSSHYEMLELIYDDCNIKMKKFK